MILSTLSLPYDENVKLQSYNKKIIDNPEFVRSAEGIYYVERSGNYFQIINGTPNRLSLKVDSETLPQYDNY